jgi:transketolase
MVDLKKRIVEIAYKHRLGHLGSYLSSVEIVDEIFSKMDKDDIFILSSGHCALALYVCLEKYHGIDAEEMFLKHGGHPHRDEQNKIYCSTGSLGLGLPIALGRAVASPNRKVWVLVSDGEAAEGSIWESLKTIYEENINNIEVFVNINGLCAYKEVNTEYISQRLKIFLPSINLRYTTVEQYPFLKGLNAHYHVMNEDNYKQVMES